jgi:hypothetical protein
MNQHDMLLVLTICELLAPEKSVDARDVTRAYEEARRKVELANQPPMEAEIYRARGSR